jgi:hypothetical protein
LPELRPDLHPSRRIFDVTNKTATATASLVAAVPAAVLGYFLVNTFLTKLGQMTTVFLGLYGVTLAACAAIVFLPFAVLIFGPKSPARGAVLPKKTKDADAATSEKAEPGIEESLEESKSELDAESIEEAAKVPISTGELEVVEAAPSDDEFGAFDAPFDEEKVATEAIDSDEFRFDDEEEEPPKTKKKK